VAWRGASSFSPFKLNPSLNPLPPLPFLPPILFLSLKRKNSEDPLEMQNRPIFFKLFSASLDRLSGCLVLMFGLGTGSRQHRNYGCSLFVYGAVSSGKA
jgi:hypothetical protein